MHKLKNNESDINSDDCNETAEECIYSFSPSKKKKNEEYYAKVSYETKFLNNLNDNNIKKENKKIYAADSEYKYSSHLNIIGLRKNENDDDKEENDSDEKGNHSDEKENDSDEKENDSDEKENDSDDKEENDSDDKEENDSDDKEENDSDDKEENDSDDKEENDSDEKENGDDYKISNDYDIDDYEDESCSDSMDKDSHLYDEELNEIIDKEYFKELIPAIPHDILNSYISCLKTCGFERQVQLHRLINLLGDLRDPISVIQILGLPGMGKTKVVKNFIKLMNVPFAYVNCLMAVYQSGRSARNVIYHTILKDLSINLLKEFNEYKKMNNVINYSYDPTKLVPNHVSSTDSFFSILHMLLSFKPENENNRNIKKNENTYNKKNSPINKNNNEIKNIKMTTNQNYYKDKLYDRSVVFILDNIRYLVRTHPDLFYALTRIHEYIKGPYNDLTKVNKTTRGLCVILINRSPLPDEIFDGLPQPPTVWFDSYTADMCKNILYRLYDTMCFESLLTINDKDLKIYYSKEKKKEFLIKRKEVILENDVIYDIWCRYVDYIINVSYKDYKSDFHELLFICSHMWPLFIRPILDGTLEPIVENMNALQRNIDTHIRVATYNHASHFTFELIDSVFLNENNLKNKIDLSFYSKILLVGAYLASRNLPITDKRFFNATVKGGAFSLPKKRKTKSKNESILTLIGQSIPKNFTFIRWLCLTDCLLVCFFDEQLILNSLICQQINTLIQLGFITFSSPNNLSCLVRNSLMNGVQWSGYCGSTLLNTTNNFSSIANNIFSESNNSMNYESLDPYTKLVIQVPEETIRNIAKEMKIPLDELII